MKAGLKTVTSGYQIMGGEVSNLVFVTTEKFRASNPTVYAAVVAALDEAIQWTNAEKTFKFAEFMHHIGALKTKPESWKDLYFAESHSLAGD